ncbi:MAG: serine/threonine-protein kinase, partial [Planctomycetota bacterium]
TIEQFSNALDSAAQTLGQANHVGDSILLRERLEQLKVQRPSPQSTGTPQHQDLQPWIAEGDTDIGRVDHYDLIRCVGRGGMGVVFEAFDHELQRAVALKIMSPALLVDETNSQRFLREARAAAAINHPSVVAIYAVSKVRELPYLVMELIDGQSLQSLLVENPKLNVDTVIDVATQLAEGLSAAHEKGVVHRDIKPANVLVQNGTGKVKLTDFGLAYTVSDTSLTKTGTLLGTPEYLAPEQIDGGNTDHRSDLFSLGSLIYHLSSGKPPFARESVVATLREVATFQPLPLAQINADVPAWLSELVGHLHQKAPHQRIENAATVADVLRSQTLQSVPTRDTTSNKLAAKWKYAGVVTLLILGFVVLAFSPLSGWKTRSILQADNSDELNEILEEYEDDLVVRLTSGEAYLMEPLEIEERVIEIFAAEGEDPQLIFDLADDESAISIKAGGRLEVTGVRVEILDEGDRQHDEDDEADEAFEESLTEIAEPEPEDEEFEDDELDREPAITCVGGSLVMTDCHVESLARTCLELIESDANLSETHLETEGLAIFYEPDVQNHLELESSTITAGAGVDFSKRRGIVSISGSTLDAG